MDSTFIYDRYVTGKDFIGRKQDCVILGNLLSQGENVALWEPPKTGKMSLIQQTLFNMRMGGQRFVVGEMTKDAQESFLKLTRDPALFVVPLTKDDLGAGRGEEFDRLVEK